MAAFSSSSSSWRSLSCSSKPRKVRRRTEGSHGLCKEREREDPVARFALSTTSRQGGRVFEAGEAPSRCPSCPSPTPSAALVIGPASPPSCAASPSSQPATCPSYQSLTSLHVVQGTFARQVIRESRPLEVPVLLVNEASRSVLASY